MVRFSCAFSPALLLVTLLTFPAIVHSSSITSKIKQLYSNLEKSYIANEGKQTSLAVFRFDTTEKMAKQKFGQAVGEMLAHHFTSDPKFKVVERAELESIFREQKLGLTGAIEEKTAVHVGH